MGALRFLVDLVTGRRAMRSEAVRRLVDDHLVPVEAAEAVAGEAFEILREAATRRSAAIEAALPPDAIWWGMWPAVGLPVRPGSGDPMNVGATRSLQRSLSEIEASTRLAFAALAARARKARR